MNLASAVSLLLLDMIAVLISESGVVGRWQLGVAEISRNPVIHFTRTNYDLIS